MFVAGKANWQVTDLHKETNRRQGIGKFEGNGGKSF